MIPHVEQFNLWSESWAALVWSITWQSTVLAVLAAGIAWLLRRSSPAVRYWLWQIVAIKLLLMPFWTFAVPMPDFLFGRGENVVATGPVPPSSGVADIEAPSVIDEQSPVGMTTDLAVAEPAVLWYQVTSWQTWLLAVWGFAVGGQAVRLVWQRRRLKRMLALVSPAKDDLAYLLRETAHELGLKSVPLLRLSEFDCSPFVCGIRRPVLVIPVSLTAILDAKQLRQVFLHVLAHVKRLDLLWGWIPEMAKLIYFFHPVAHWVAYRIRLERELACDQLAMAHSGQDAADYAKTLVDVVSHTSQPPAFRTAAAASAGLDGLRFTTHDADPIEESNLEQEQRS